MGIARWLLTLTHTDHLAEAIAVALAAKLRMIPIVTPEEMGAIDAAGAGAGRGADRAGRGARWPGRRCDLLGGAYGRRVVIVDGQGQQRQRRARRGAPAAARGACGWSSSTPPTPAPPTLPAVRPGDRRRLRHRVPGHVRAARRPGGDAGAGGRHPVGGRRPDRRGARPGAARPIARSRSPRSSRACCSGAGRSWPGAIEVADIGLDASAAAAPPRRPRPTSPAGCPRGRPTRTSGEPPSGSWPAARAWAGAAALAVRRRAAGGGRLRAGQHAGRRADRRPARSAPRSVARRPPPRRAGPAQVLDGLGRFRAARGRQRAWAPADETAAADPGAWSPGRRCPTVVDADGLDRARAWTAGPCRRRPSSRPTTASTSAWRASRPGRIASTRPARWPRATGAIVLLKGPTTVVAHPDGRVLVTRPATPAWPPRAPATCWPG